MKFQFGIACRFCRVSSKLAVVLFRVAFTLHFFFFFIGVNQGKLLVRHFCFKKCPYASQGL